MRTNPICIVTGGSGFLGTAIVEHMLLKGFKVVAIDLIDPPQKNKDIEFIKCDITDFMNMKKVIDYIGGKYNGIDVLINNAAIDHKVKKSIRVSKDFLSDSFDTLENEFRVSILGSLICTQLVGLHMIKNPDNFKSIVFMGSDLSVIAPNQNIYVNANNYQEFFKPISYSLIKHAVVGIVKYLAVEFAKYNISVNCVSPGPIANQQPDYLINNLKSQIPMKRLANVADIVGAIEFLVSSKARYITGQNLLIDGGRTIW